MENQRLRLLRLGKSKGSSCGCTRRKAGAPRTGRGMCKNHYRPQIYLDRRRWKEWEGRARQGGDRDDPPATGRGAAY